MVAIHHMWNQHILGSMCHLDPVQRSRTSCQAKACSSSDFSRQGQRLKCLIWQIILTLTQGNYWRCCCMWKQAWIVIWPMKWAHQYHMKQQLGCYEQQQKVWLRKSLHLFEHRKSWLHFYPWWGLKAGYSTNTSRTQSTLSCQLIFLEKQNTTTSVQSR